MVFLPVYPSPMDYAYNLALGHYLMGNNRQAKECLTKLWLDQEQSLHHIGILLRKVILLEVSSSAKHLGT